MALTRRSFTRTLAGGLAAAYVPHLGAQQGGLFQHGVASGDPLTNRVILWTRLSPPLPESYLPVEWAISDDPNMRTILQNGITYTNSAFDYTVKVDVGRLNPGQTYYYRFSARGTSSPIGRTKTLPVGSVDRLRMAVVSCSNYPYGFFNAYRNIAVRADLDAVIHLGDYIYEYGNGQYGDGTALNRLPSPAKEIVTLADYRQRYAQYRSDPDLQEAHRQHPWIVVWDDHETTNDAWLGGAQNHSPDTEGDWSARRWAGNQAWFEWMPVRENYILDSQIYRTFHFGDLADLVMLDTRLAGRSQQVAATSPLTFDPNRTLLGAEQEDWLQLQLTTSKRRGARWRLLGQQTMMGQLFNPDGTAFNPDQWDGYPLSRASLLGFLGANSINNVVVLTGDIHTSWGNEIAVNPFAPSTATRQAVEFVTPGVTSPGIDDRAQATGLQQQILGSHPHVKYVELFERGYMLLDVTHDRAQAEWYHLGTIRERSTDQTLGRVLAVGSGETSLVQSAVSLARNNSAVLAP